MEPSPCTAHMKVGEGRGGEGVRLDPDGSGDSPAEAEGWSGRGGQGWSRKKGDEGGDCLRRVGHDLGCFCAIILPVA